MVVLLAAVVALQSLQDRLPELIELAKSAIRAEILGEPSPKVATKSAPSAVFVTIEQQGRVIGCRGSLEPRTSCVEEDLLLAARSAAKHDPRCKPLTKRDLADFQVTVTLVKREEPITNVAGLEPQDGLVLESGSKKGIVLPWEGKDPNIRLKWAYQKAGVPVGGPAKLFRLIAIRSRG